MAHILWYLVLPLPLRELDDARGGNDALESGLAAAGQRHGGCRSTAAATTDAAGTATAPGPGAAAATR